MKQIAFGTGAFFTSVALLGSLFKIMHWPGAGVMFVIGVVGLALIAVPAIAIYKYRKV